MQNLGLDMDKLPFCALFINIVVIRLPSLYRRASNTVTQLTNTIPPPDSFVSLRILPLLPALLNPPVLTDLTWSALVHSATQRNLTAFGGGLRVGV
jgi:hypothetical protein